jgi:hypothetical protein
MQNQTNQFTSFYEMALYIDEHVYTEFYQPRYSFELANRMASRIDLMINRQPKNMNIKYIQTCSDLLQDQIDLSFNEYKTKVIRKFILNNPSIGYDSCKRFSIECVIDSKIASFLNLDKSTQLDLIDEGVNNIKQIYLKYYSS